MIYPTCIIYGDNMYLFFGDTSNDLFWKLFKVITVNFRASKFVPINRQFRMTTEKCYDSVNNDAVLYLPSYHCCEMQLPCAFFFDSISYKMVKKSFYLFACTWFFDIYTSFIAIANINLTNQKHKRFIQHTGCLKKNDPFFRKKCKPLFSGAIVSGLSSY